MEEKLIACVAAYPVLYDTSLYSYKYIHNKYEAWCRVADVVGAPGVFFNFQIQSRTLRNFVLW